MDIALSQDLLNEQELQSFTYTKFWPRVGAFLIDRVVMLAITPLVLYNTTHWRSYLFFTGLVLVQFIYKPFLEYEYGATLGKMALGIKVVNYQYQKPGFKEIFLRNIIVVTEFILTLAFGLYNYYYHPALSHTQNSSQIGSYGTMYFVIIIADAILFILNIIDALFLATAKDGRSLHDRIGKTFVVRTS